MAENNQNTLLWAIGGVLIILGVIYFSVAGGPGNTLKIGVIAPLTGDAASYGTMFQKVNDLAVSEINAVGGVNGKQIELVYEDGKCDSATAAAAAQKLVNVDRVKFILGGICSGETLAAAEITQPARVLLLSPSSTSPDITDSGDLVFRTYPSDDFEVRIVAAYAKESGLERAAIISENTDFAQGVRNAFKTSYEGELVFDESYITGETDFRTLITRMRSANPQMVYVAAQTNVSGELILKQIQEDGMNVGIFAVSSMLDRSAIAANASMYEEVVMAEVPLPAQGKAADMFASYRELYGNAPEFFAYSASGYDSVYLLAEAINAVGEDPEDVASYFNFKVVDWPGAIGTFNFDENGDAEVELTLVQAIGGALVPLAE